MAHLDGIQGILLDIGWTLNRPASGHWMIPRSHADRVYAALDGADPEKVRIVNARAMAFLDADHLIHTEAQEEAQFAAFYEIFRQALPDLGFTRQDSLDMAREKVRDVGNLVFFDDVAGAVRHLASRYPLGILSDTWPSTRRVLEDAGLLPYFKSLTFSCHLGVWKPHPGMYHHALRGLGTPPGATLFVDDSPVCLAGAVQAGIRPLRIQRRPLTEDWRSEAGMEVRDTPVIYSLWDLTEEIENR